ncbi:MULTISPECIES: hypothetical protein [Micromonospora]|uniref:hypothetical protein n=1 Tax=Micromonospora TaxID=1873 RepID=UPI00098D30D7|nr:MULTISPECIES: hypothetical protein [unclassified Micromonospora]MDI5939160.1 hypothetical protein [Micromonospora sp. DH15]OON28095.1 hypothetical protein BSA16_28465 [Micromonospora sp. Rc5]
MAWHAADVHRADLPAGVRLAGVLALAAAGPGAATNPGSPEAELCRTCRAPTTALAASPAPATGDYADGCCGRPGATSRIPSPRRGRAGA